MHLTRLRLAVLLGVLLLAAVPDAARAQAGMGTDVITGTVTGPDGQPIADANVEATSLETQVTRRARTDGRGRFTILFPDGGGQYRMTARAIGMSPRIEMLARYADEDRLVWNVRLQGGTVTLEAINVTAGPQIVRAPEGPTPGSSERALNFDQVTRIPVDNTDLALLTSLVPGIVTFGATDTTATAFSVAGLGTDANALTLDGLLFGTSSIPQEGLRQTRVVTSTYDVSRGSFSGGLIASTTRSGSNMVQGSSQYQLREDDLAVTADTSAYAQGFTQHVLSGGIGGPIVRDRLFVYGSVQARLRSDPQQTLVTATPTDLTRLGVSPDSVQRFYAILQSLGVPPLSVAPSATRSNDNLSGLARLDYVVSNAHTLTLRGDWRGMGQDPTRLGATALPQTGGEMTTAGGGVMATLTSRFGATAINEMRAYWQTSSRDGTPYSSVPQGRVTVASDLPDGATGVTTLVFGGNPGLPSSASSRSLELTDEVSWLPGTGAHRLKLGAFYLAERSSDFTANNQLGTFSFNSLGELEQGLAASFRRTLNVPERLSRSQRWGAYLGDVWMLSRQFQLTYGARLEGSNFSDAPPYNPAVDSVFGRRTDQLPSEWHLSPRAGFSWSLGGGATPGGGGATGGPGFARFLPPTTVIRGGVGEFRSQPPAGIVSQARGASGVGQSASDLFCAGVATSVPTPDWPAYWNDPAAIPASCPGTTPPPGGLPTSASAIVVMADGFEASRAWRGSLALERRLTQLFRLTVEGSFSRGVAQAGYRDLNLDATPRFALADEGNRPVYVPAQAIAASGTPQYLASRVDPSYGFVLEAYSGLRSRAEQLTVGIGGIVGRGITVQTSYTWQQARDELAGIRGGSTAADPNAAEWARSDFERRHSFLATVTYPLSRSVEVTSILRAASGAPFTPLVGGDVNGDGSRNDRAFIFAADQVTSVGQGMTRLLATASGGVRSCLEGQTGAVAARNSCTGPWQTSLDFQVNWRPTLLSLNRRMTLSLVTVNFLRGLDELLHGADGARGWGLATRPDGTLLYVTGFDTVQQRYTYDVNERFGATYGSATAVRPPFQLGLQVRISIGPDRMQQAMDAMRAGGGPGGGGGPGMMGAGATGGFGMPSFTPADIIRRIETALPNPAAAALAMRDSLALDSSQVLLLVPVRDSLDALRRTQLDSARAILGRRGNNPSAAQLMEMMPLLRPLFEALRNEQQEAVVTVRAILRPEQFERLPEAVRSPGRVGFGPGQRGGPEGQPRPRP
jgi:hypothetical protein